MPKPTKEELEVLKSIRSEIAASGSLKPEGPHGRGYNKGIFVAVEILDRYIEGKGLFQQ